MWKWGKEDVNVQQWLSFCDCVDHLCSQYSLLRYHVELSSPAIMSDDDDDNDDRCFSQRIIRIGSSLLRRLCPFSAHTSLTFLFRSNTRPAVIGKKRNFS